MVPVGQGLYGLCRVIGRCICAFGDAAAGSGNGSGTGGTHFIILANWSTSLNYPTSALMDDVAVFNRALIATEISNLYTGNWGTTFMPRLTLLGAG
jgi:hypothetical protein